MPTPKFTSLDHAVLFGVTGAKATPKQLELSAALDHLKSGLADLAHSDSSNETLQLALILALSRRRGGGGGAPAELGLPRTQAVTSAPIAARPHALYA